MKNLNIDEIFRLAEEAEVLPVSRSKSRSKANTAMEFKIHSKADSTRATISVALAEALGIYDSNVIKVQAVREANLIMLSTKNPNRSAMTFTISRSQIASNKEVHGTVTVQDKGKIDAIIDVLNLKFNDDNPCITFSEINIVERDGVKYATVLVPDEFAQDDTSESA